MIEHAAVLLRRGCTCSGARDGRVGVSRLGKFGSTTSASPLLAQSSLSNRTTPRRVDIQKSLQSSYAAALHPSAPASAAVDTSTSSGTSPAYQFEPYDLQSRRPRTRLPTPLPPNITEKRKEELKRRLRDYQVKAKAKGQGVSAKDRIDAEKLAIKSPAFGDLSRSALQSLSQNDSFFTPSQTVENLAILRACLTTGLTHRASKIFDSMREEAYNRSVELSLWSPDLTASEESESVAGSSRNATNSAKTKYTSVLNIKFYNAILGAYLRKAWQEEETSRRVARSLEKSWQLLDAMAKGREGSKIQTDPLPDAETFAVMTRGLVRLIRGNRLPNNQQNLTNLLVLIRQSGIRLQDILFSKIFTEKEGEMEYFGGTNLSREGEPDAQDVLHTLGPVVAEMGDVVLSSDLDAINRTMQGMDEEATQKAMEATTPSVEKSQVPTLRPVLNRKAKANDESEIVLNLQILRENLSIVDEAKKTSSDPYERQNWLEFGAMDAARKRFEVGTSSLEPLGLHNAGSLKKKDLQNWMWTWYKMLVKTLKENIARMQLAEETTSSPKDAGGNPRSLEAQLLPFIKLLSPEKLAMLTILEIMRMQGTSGVTDGTKTASALVQIGKAVEREHYTQSLRKSPNYFTKTKQMQTQLWQGGLTTMNLRRDLRSELDQENRMEGHSLGWSSSIRARVGSFLVQHLMNVATVKRSAIDRDGVSWEEDQPAFYSAYQYIQGKRLGVIRLNEVVSKRLAKDNMLDTLHPRHLPMLVPPKPWLTYDSGGYYSVKTRVLRYKDDFEQGSYLRAASEDGSLEHILAGLDVLGSTAWTINKEVFAVVTEVWNSGKGIAEVPPSELSEEDPIRPENYDNDIKARATFLSKMKQHNMRKLANHGQRCDVNYRLEIARAFMGEKFFFPHNMDFRGRAYPLPPHLNHIGNDLSRGLLLFAEGKPLGSVGLRWLRIHLANVYGFDKASFSEREQFAIDHEKDIRKTVQDPMGEGNWWLEADDPWQCLATCMELVKAQDHPEGPERYECRLPVHQDGTCNGLQHYAALGGDMAGAKQVNLSSGDRPSDVYTAVADLVINVVERDAKAGMELAKLVQGKITRKVVKQTVMTTVYGVTFIGAKDQVARQLEDRGLPTDQIWSCSTYLAKQIMGCIGDLFSGAEAIQNWLTDSALLIAKSIPPERLKDIKSTLPSGSQAKTAQQLSKEQMTSVIWTTPLGLPVVQPYRKVLRKQVATTMQSVYIHDPYLATQVSPAKQGSAFPPNFIHSLDATHMLLTALECQSAKLTFASVHDSYWTHACDIETMSDIIRDTFVRLHRCDILQKLQDEFLERYAGYVVPVKVAKDSLAKREKRALKRAKVEEEASGTMLVEETESGELKVKEDPLRFEETTIDSGLQQEVEAMAEEEVDATVAKSVDDVEEASLPEEGEEEEEVSSSSSSPPRPSNFVLLKDILPAIPQKGAFDVNEIKRSLYFFS